MLEDGRSGRKQRKSLAVCEAIEDENVVNRASQLVFLVHENRVFKAHLLGTSELHEMDWNCGTMLAMARWFTASFPAQELVEKNKKRGTSGGGAREERG
jgi:hypothetical protein